MAILKHLLQGLYSGLPTNLLADTTSVLLLACAILAVYVMFKHYGFLRSLPPGPWGYPIVGILFSIKKEFHLFLTDYSKIFGKVFSFKMGRETIVVLSNYKTIKKAFQSNDFIARPKTELTELLGGYGVVNSEGELWKSQRRYLLNQKLGMRHWGPGMDQIEQRVQHEAFQLIDTLYREHNSTPVNPAALINCAVSNVICSMIMSTRFEHTSKQFQHFMHMFDEGFRLFTLTGAMIFLPFLKHMPGVARACKQLRSNREEMLGFVRDIIRAHKANLDYDHPKDLIDSYLIAIDKLKQEEQEENNNRRSSSSNISGSSNTSDMFHGFEPEQQLEQIILDLFSAGVETLKTSMLWAIVYMLHNPEVMGNVQQELDDKVGTNRLPTVKDMNELPYTKATMYEIMRRSSVVPMGTTHSTDRTVEFEGYTIPKNAHVIPLLHAVHMDPEHWDEPEQFRPERFLCDDGNTVRKPEHFIPFGVGKRKCLGDHLAEKEFFLFFATLLHCFELKNPEGVSLPNLRGVAAVTVTPQDFEVVCIPRNVDALHESRMSLQEDQPLWSHCRTYG